MPRRTPITDQEKEEAKSRRKRRRLLRKVKRKQEEIRTKTRPFSADSPWHSASANGNGNGGTPGDPSRPTFTRTKPPRNGSSTVTENTPEPEWQPSPISGRGRPCLLSPEVMRSIAENVSMGAYFNVAVRAAGIAIRTAQTWRKKGDEFLNLIEAGRQDEISIDDFKYVQFAQAIMQAEGVARLKAEQIVYAGDPRFWLRVGPGRDKPDDPGWSERVEHSGPGGKGIPFTMSIEDLVSRAILPDHTRPQD